MDVLKITSHYSDHGPPVHSLPAIQTKDSMLLALHLVFIASDETSGASTVQFLVHEECDETGHFRTHTMLLHTFEAALKDRLCFATRFL